MTKDEDSRNIQGLGMSATARLVLAEDERIIALGLKMFLTQLGHEVCGIAKTAPEAVRMAAEFRPDLALLDVRLADGTDGLDAAREIQERFGIPIILITGHLDPAQAADAGALGLLRKPFEPRHLQDIVSAAITWRRLGRLADPPPPGWLLGEYF